MSAVTQADKLVRMANQIATFFRSYPEEEAVAGIQKHIKAFWTPKMIAHLEAALPEQGDRIDGYVRRALHGAEPAADSPVRPATRDPQLAGAGASDAG
ncbi:formate dehydrogenase subunit delta [Methylobacterium radiotolerans]|jgi:formate dehydrogenase subunit delta|uniref:formate dehydrogenase subunit delta n=1 Tax=Methylobacterium TaxID=407 RepID=UPI0005DB623B|nr:MULTISPECIES: formate dehydrogenase subunit delta [Methylobacterium]GAN48216.1 NAD-dependent formate dehydrogenase, molybdenum containing subunit delta [Methylobacterium sp. ME121]MBN6821399.1 formate dehydrogenase subunit delta [Methylobacterium organophilum]MDE3746247.1 formate dehydrogenase subunit delta [Methylobacterium radiotolerans]OXE40496.1 peptidase [Methylobacterium radiotolerans]PVZ03851.1 formate dehydrogenase subunit delta [Methylobacterium organophilum]